MRRANRGLSLLALFLIAVAVAIATAAGPAAAQNKDYFGRKAPADPPAASKSVAAPGFLQRIVAQIAVWQRDLNERLASEITAYKTDGKLAPVIAILVISFLYGVFHAAGPGHGKFIVASFFVANRARIWHGFAMSGLIAFVQALSAILLVVVFALILGVGSIELTRNVVWIEMVSYGLIGLLGLWIIWGGLVGRGCSHDHGPNGHGADGHGDHVHGHDHSHSHSHSHGAHSHGERPEISGWAMVPAAIAAGIRPCTGSILVLLFTLAQGILLVGILGAVVMAAGVALSVSLVALVTILLRRGVSQATRPSTRIANAAHRLAGIAGGLVVVGVGGLLFLGAAQRTGIL